jgi:Transposase DDE domain.
MKSYQVISSILQAANQRINSNSFLEEHRIGNAFTRSGKLSFSGLIYFILQATHKSLSINYAQLRAAFSPTNHLPLVSKQALSKARQGISHKAFLALLRISVEQYYQHFKNLRLWNGFHIYAVDGSTIQIPDSIENVESFGANPNKTGKLSPLASVSVLYDVMNDILVDVSLNAYRYNERRSVKEHILFLPKFSNSIILFDRGYPSEELFRFLHSQGILFLMRLPRTFKKAVFEQDDILFTYPAFKSEEELTLRSLHFTLDDGSTEYLVTNLMPEQLEVSQFSDLYQKRWGIESKYRELKNRLEIESFNCMKPIAIRQEFFAAMFLSNLTAILKQAADYLIPEISENKHVYQSSRSYILNRMKYNIVFLLRTTNSTRGKIIAQLLEEAIRVRSIVRPNRKFGRYRKNTRRRYYIHMKSCI